MCPLALLSFLILSDILVSLKLVSCLAVVMEEYMKAFLGAFQRYVKHGNLLDSCDSGFDSLCVVGKRSRVSWF